MNKKKKEKKAKKSKTESISITVSDKKINSITAILGYVRDINICIIFLASSVVSISYLVLKHDIKDGWSKFLLVAAILIGYLPAFLLFVKSLDEIIRFSTKREWKNFILAIMIFAVFFVYFCIVSGFFMYEKIKGLTNVLP